MFGFSRRAKADGRLYSTKDLATELGQSTNAIHYRIEKLGIAPVRKFAGKNAYGETALKTLDSFFKAKKQHVDHGSKQQVST